MKRDLSVKINAILDNWVPPVLRDNEFFAAVMLRIATGRKYRYYMEFKQRLSRMSEKEINRYYQLLADTFIHRETDLNTACVNRILSETEGETVLDAASGKGYMAELLYNRNHSLKITASDIILPKENDRAEGISYVQASLTSMPFGNNSFDTVICSHALEHIRDEKKALGELRRICKRKLIIVVPCQREYQYTCDLHVNFYPYRYCVESLLKDNKASIELVAHDWMCIEYMR